MSKKAIFTVLTIVVAFMLGSCNSHSVYNNNIDIPNSTWSIDSIAQFNVDISDTTSVHNVYINLRNTTSYANSNLYLFIHTTAPSGAMLRDTLECILANSRGEWLGKGFGALRDNQILYKQYIRFPEKGTYHFSIQHGMRTQQLKGIASVGIRVKQTKL